MRIDRSYPVVVELKVKYISTCKNEKLKSSREFTVDRKKSEMAAFQWDFTANFGKTQLSWLGAGDRSKNKGVCNNVKTEDHSSGCGLATTLMEFCFTDFSVGSLELEKDKHFEKVSLTKWRELALKNCQHIVFLACAPYDGTPDIACLAYFTAAINTMHTIMFSYQQFPLDNGPETMKVWDVTKTKSEFKKDATRWTLDYGFEWYFCQCKLGRQSECKKMSEENDKNV